MVIKIMAEIKLNNIPYRNLACWTFWKENDYEFIVIFSTYGTVKLNKMGSKIWKNIDGYNSIKVIINNIYKDFPNIDKKKIKKDIIEFMSPLQKG